MTVEYASGYKAIVKEVPRKGMCQLAPGQSEMGYGNKISTDYMVQFPNNHIFYRVYAVCHSNVASHYILKGKKRLFLKDSELEVALGR